ASETLKPLLVQQIQAYWQHNHEDERKGLRRIAKAVFQFLFTKKQKTTATSEHIKSHFSTAFQAVTSYVPVIFATPEAAHIFADAPEGAFDYILIEDTQNSFAQRYAPFFRLTQKMITFNDSYAPSEKVLVSDLLQKRGAATANLVQLHTQNVGYLQQFKASIQGNTLPALANYRKHKQDLQVLHAAGRFNEKAGTNEVEAQEVIRQLNRIAPTPQRTYPSVGIVCFTTEQRDLIVTYLSTLRRENGTAKKLVQALDRNGLGVFRADELYGQRFDTVLLSCTFGTKDLAGSLTEHIHQLATPQASQLVRLILGSAAKECIIINSIPDTELVAFANDSSVQGLYLLANLIEYANAVERSDQNLQDEILTLFAGENKVVNTSVFKEEVAEALRPYFETGRVRENITVANSRQNLPIVVQPTWDDKWKNCIYPEGLLENPTILDYRFAYQQQMQLAQSGYLYTPVWSIDWWKNPKFAARKLASKIIKQEGKG
ncbi:MAG: hypothetical protein AAF738_06970, partial [Bacteroidota bacterium]